MNDQCNPNESAIFSIQDGEVMGGTVCAIMTSDGKPQSFKQKTTILNGVSTISFIDEDGIEVSAIDGKIVPCSSIVYVGNQTAGGGGSSTDYTALITAIKNSVQSIDGDTDALAGILLAVDTLESIGTTGNATTSQILTAVSSILTQAQETNANTDQLEALLTSLSTTLQTESDQTQAGLVDIKEAIVTTKNAVFEHGFSAPNTFSSKSFDGYKSLSVRVLSGSIEINDGTNSVTYPLAGDDGNVAGVNYSFHEGFTINNTISVFKQSAASSFIWTGVK